MRALPLLLACSIALATSSFARGEELPNFQVPAGAALIFNAGAAGVAGYRIVVLPSGKTDAVDGAGRSTGKLSSDLAAKFFRDVSAAMPLSKLPTSPCERAPAPVLPVFVLWGGQRSPDVSCRSNLEAAALDDDVKAIARALYVTAYRKRSVSKFVTGTGGAPSLPATAPPPPQMPSNPYPHY